MSRKVDITDLNDKQLRQLSKDLEICIPPSKYALGSAPKFISLFEKEGNTLYIPFAYAKKYIRPKRSDFHKTKMKFNGTLRPEQKEVKTEAIERLNKTGSVIIASYPGFGKTCLAIYIASRIQVPTLIICHRVVLINQWKNSIKKFCPNASVTILKPSNKKKPNKNSDFYIINAENVRKYGAEFFSFIGLATIDENHLIMAERLSECMKYICPRYVLGLSATPYRTDGLNILLDMYFGEHKIIRKLYRKHLVYKITTNFKPEIKYNKMGKVDWGAVIDFQSNHPERNELILSVIKKHSDRVFLVLCKRVSQANYLFDELKKRGEDVTSLIGSQQEYKESSRILIGTTQKCSVGFDHPRLNTLLLASDMEQYFVQVLGRVFRTKEGVPMVFDIVDNYSLLVKHWRTRRKVYLEHGGEIKECREYQQPIEPEEKLLSLLK